jgi:cell division protein FtsI (penicillin-binding protein 3)
MNEASRHNPEPPSPDALPGNRLREPAVAESTSRALVRVSQPDLLRHAQLEKSRGRLLLAAFGFLVLFGSVAVKLSLATVFDPAEPKRAAMLSRPPAPPAETPVSRAAVTDRNGEVLATPGVAAA